MQFRCNTSTKIDHSNLLLQVQQRYAVFAVNLKPAKFRGIMSEAMVLCACTSDQVEIIEPPAGVKIGDRVMVDGYAGKLVHLLISEIEFNLLWKS